MSTSCNPSVPLSNAQTNRVRDLCLFSIVVFVVGLPLALRFFVAWVSPFAFVPISPLSIGVGTALSLVLSTVLAILMTQKHQDRRVSTGIIILRSQWLTLFLAYLLVWLSMFMSGSGMGKLSFFSDWLNHFYPLYSILFSSWLFVLVLLGGVLSLYASHEGDKAKLRRGSMVMAILAPLFFVGIPCALSLLASIFSPTLQLPSLSLRLYRQVALLGVFVSLTSLVRLYYLSRKGRSRGASWFLWLKLAGIGLFCAFLAMVLMRFAEVLMYAQRQGLGELRSPQELMLLVQPMWQAAVLLAGSAFIVLFTHKILRARQMALGTTEKETSGEFGSASFADSKTIEKADFYSPEKGILSGQDSSGKYIFLPLANKLTLSPQGGGKTVASSIPALLSHKGSVFVFDVKGELWATTARHRQEKMGRTIITLDPFNVRGLKGFADNKPAELLKFYTINPLDWLPETQGELDRIINNFAASLIMEEKGNNLVHFDENAEILIRGYIDYIVRGLPKGSRRLMALHRLISEDIERAKVTFEAMATLGGRAGAAANQVMRAGADERGSILTTTYRQLDWIADTNIQAILKESNFDLRDFLKGNMDIYIILPEDQTKQHSRLVRMLLSILLNLIAQVPPHELPKEKMLFLLDELAQLDYCPDVEKAIEVMRARGVVVWAVFQTLSQIELFKKPDLFKGAKIKQIFTNDDVPTMEWIQKLGGKKTILTKSFSTNKGDSKQRMQWVGGSTSKGEGENIHETGTDLIQLNEIRELAENEQWLFVQGIPPIHCMKIPYYDYPPFKGQFDANPLENRAP